MAKTILRKMLPFLIFLIFWEGLAVMIQLRRHVAFPTPWEVAQTLAALLAGAPLSEASLIRHIGDSLLRWVTGFSIAAVTGIGYGLLSGWSKAFRDATLPILHVLQLIPGLAWIPVAILCFGIGETATISMIAVTAFPPIALNVLSGVQQLDETLLRAARMMGAKGQTLLFRVLLPGALPATISGLRIGLGNGWRVLVAAEMVVGTGTGLGYAIIEARWTLDYASAFSCIGIICLIGLLVENLLFKPLEKRTITRWYLTRDGA
ncbi:ABC transporter permease [Desulfoluna sp.]|uniref:ABC transporter permease n=1 Tax=Desulfoluna sp. TaxID=2045199 RepID=UPI0026197F41|nr:ABC transporter permease [Desulfoluna sp.]